MGAISKGEFARRRNVSPGRVSQWLSAGKIFGPAIVGEGRAALIDEEIACQQLQVRLHIDQRLSGNGLKTNLEAMAPVPALPNQAPELPIADTVERQIAEEKLIGMRRQNREKATAEAIALGQLVAADEARRATGKEIAQLIARVDGALPELAAAIAAKFKLPARDVLHELKGRWRQIRADAAIEARERAEPMPEKTGFDLNPDSEC